ncbi:transketolase [Natronosporangium hydrolyticum]|uniref:Transketolase n=1 Tax=Natronosporangium hydrolyticum TaxID=2811111 RepID=A0A895Y9C6_9ACTN|nr:transketolase [Natronosporangium hydrolyticum]QSB12872.1 transketolase [Natronosporangium hydrolyticum]
MPLLRPDPPAISEWRAARERIRSAPADHAEALLRDHARAARASVVRMIDRAGAGHVGGDLSVTDILTTLYFAVLDIDPAAPADPERDCFVLSKGHSAAALYSTLAAAGYFPRRELDTFMAPGSALNGHPARQKVPGVVTSTGPLGHGLPVAVGTAIAAKLRRSPARTYVVTGDGELQEGSNWEAAMSAAHAGLDNLALIVDRNRLQQGARTEQTNRLDPLDEKFTSFGWEVRTVDGHHYGQLRDACTAPSARPVAIIADTVKGKGVSFMEDRVEWHHKVPDVDQVRQALAELAGVRA